MTDRIHAMDDRALSVLEQVAEIRERLAPLAVSIGNEGNLDPILAIDRELVSIESEIETRMEPVPFVAIGHGEEAPWSALPLTCPTCGEENLPLLDSTPSGLHYIKHCAGVWMRGPFTYRGPGARADA